jgi:fermentation-respiration switch protein FrsA (DUF1100 family)
MIGIELVATIAAGSVGLAAAAVAGSAWLALFPWLPRDLGGAPDLDGSARRLRIPVAPDDAIDAWFLPGGSRGVVLVLHGYGRTHHRAWRYGGFLSRAGYSILTFDFRSSRAFGSGRRLPTTLGHYELPDAQAALDWIHAQPELAGAPIAVFGESLGGTVALRLAAANPCIAAVVVDCAFATGLHALEDSSERWARVPRWPAAALMRSVGRAVTGLDPGAVDAIDAALRLRDRPLFFIHSLKDDRLSTDHVDRLWEAAGAKDPVWIIPDAGHNQGWVRHPTEYAERVLEFLDAWIAARAPRGVA